MHRIRILHKDLYCIAGRFSKRDKLGIHARIEAQCLHALELAIEAAFKPTTQKLGDLKNLRVRAEVLKHLVRTEHELQIIDDKTYLRISEQLVEISKMTNGWINYTQKGA
ncbi:MAG: four helix bundle protein [bacterium]|nr:four helix bundle protein [bacterium]